jgi:hypothetical protein
LYPLVGLLVWPRELEAEGDIEPGIASAAAATGPLGTGAALFAWSGFWILSAVLWLFPANRAGGAISSTIGDAASGQPSWYAHFETSVANGLPHSGSVLAWLLAGASLVIAAGPLLSRRIQPYLVAGAVLQALFWVTGMALGGILTGMGTDPNAAPLVALLAFAMLPTLREVPVSAPGRVFLQRHPVAGVTTSAAAVAVLVISATYPIAAAESASASPNSSHPAAMAGMSMGSSRSTSPARTAKGGMDMPGMDGQADPNWHYTGPPCPPARCRC